MREVNKNILKVVYQRRSVDSRKYDYGLVLVIGGGEFYSGAPALSALAAFRSGADMVRVVAPKRAADIVASFSPDLAAYGIDGEWLTREHLPLLFSMTENAKTVSKGNVAVVIGGGLGRSEETQATVRKYLQEIDVPAVIDADAIHAIGGQIKIAEGKKFLFTPHGYEFFMLTGRDIRQKPFEERIKNVQDEARRLGTTILLKGAVDIISNGAEVFLNKFGSPYMTKGGTGDTLAGICGSLMSRGIDPLTAAQAAAYINAKAGIAAAREKKDGLLATDIIEAIPEIIR